MFRLVPRFISGRGDSIPQYFLAYSEQLTRVNGGFVLLMAFSNKITIIPPEGKAITRESPLRPEIFNSRNGRILSLQEYARIHRESPSKWHTNLIVASFKSLSQAVEYRSTILRDVLKLGELAARAIESEGGYS